MLSLTALVTDGVLDANGQNMNCAGNVTISLSDGFTHGNNLLTFDGSSAQSFIAPNGETLYNFTIANTGGASTVITLDIGSSNTLTIANAFHIEEPVTFTVDDNGVTVPAGLAAAFKVSEMFDIKIRKS